MRTESFHDEFPINEHYLFFNHAAVSPIPKVAAQALEEYARDASQNALMNSRAWAKAGSARKLFAAKVGCEESEAALTKNTTAGISIVANGLDWQPGDNVVLANIEFPSNVYPWWAQEQRGVELKWVTPVGSRLRLEDYCAAVDDRTRVVAVSHVQFCTGFRANLDGLGKFCKERGILLVVDGIQSCGALPIDVKKSQVSALACGVHKWLLSPPGLGLFYCEKQLCEKLKVWSPGAGSVVRSHEYTNYDLTYPEGTTRFSSGSTSVIAACALEAVLKMMAEIGEDQIEARIKHITDRLCAGLEERGYEVYSPRGEGEWSGIVIFAHKDHSSKQIVSILAKNRIVTRVRSERVRVAPHFYNTDEQIETLLATLP